MAFTSIGYDGTVNERQWAELVPSVGSATYGVKGVGDLKVTAVPGQPLTVSVAAGSGWGHGVMDSEVSNTTIACDTITSGTRWDLIALRRDWQPLAGGPTSAVKVTGSTGKAIPGSRKVTPGVEDDQPLALVQWTAGQTQPTAIVDLRCWAGNGGLIAADELALTYLNKPGASVKIGSNNWSYGPMVNGTAGWTNEDGSGPWTSLTLGTGWINNGGSVTSARLVGRGAFLHVTGDVRYPSGSIFEGWVIAQLPAGLTPADTTFVPGTTNEYGQGAIFYVTPSGIKVGPKPVGNICQFNGLAAMK